jgi:protein SCO1/2
MHDCVGSHMKRYVSFALFVLGLAGMSFAAYRLGASRSDRLTMGGDADSGLVVPARGMPTMAPPAGNKRSDKFARVNLTTHEGKQIQFYEDLAKDKKIAVNFMYTVCKGICPGMTANIKKVREDLAKEGVDDICFVSVSIEPDKDTPERLAAYMEVNGIENKPGMCPWIFLTGDIQDIDYLRKSMGVYDLNPEIDEDRTQHGGILTFGNDRTNWWCASPALQRTEKLKEVILRITRDRAPLNPPRLDPVPLASR